MARNMLQAPLRAIAKAMVTTLAVVTVSQYSSHFQTIIGTPWRFHLFLFRSTTPRTINLSELFLVTACLHSGLMFRQIRTYGCVMELILLHSPVTIGHAVEMLLVVVAQISRVSILEVSLLVRSHRAQTDMVSGPSGRNSC